MERLEAVFKRPTLEDRIWELHGIKKNIEIQIRMNDRELKKKKKKLKDAMMKNNQKDVVRIASSMVNIINTTAGYNKIITNIETSINGLKTADNMKNIGDQMKNITKQVLPMSSQRVLERTARQTERFEKAMDNVEMQTSYFTQSMIASSSSATNHEDITKLIQQAEEEFCFEFNLDADALNAAQSMSDTSEDPNNQLEERLAKLRNSSVWKVYETELPNKQKNNYEEEDRVQLSSTQSPKNIISNLNTKEKKIYELLG